MQIRTITSYLALTTLIVTIAACGFGGGGGGGGGSDEERKNYPGDTELQVERDALDSGDITDVSVTLTNINDNGVILKFHYPNSLKFLRDSAMIYIGDAETWQAVTPFTETGTSDGRYLVFFISRPDPNESNRVVVSFNIKAVATDPEAYIEIDLDNNDPTMPDSWEFSATDPKFSDIDRWPISIDGNAPVATPTSATGTPTSGTPAATPTVAPTATKAAG